MEGRGGGEAQMNPPHTLSPSKISGTKHRGYTSLPGNTYNEPYFCLHIMTPLEAKIGVFLNKTKS
jgi:hypothetical protein